MCTSPISKCTSVCALRPCGNICLNPASPATSCLRVHPATARCDAHRGAWPLARRRLRLLAFGRCWAWPLGRLLRSALRLQHKCVCHLLRMTDTPDKTDPLNFWVLHVSDSTSALSRYILLAVTVLAGIAPLSSASPQRPTRSCLLSCELVRAASARLAPDGADEQAPRGRRSELLRRRGAGELASWRRFGAQARMGRGRCGARHSGSGDRRRHRVRRRRRGSGVRRHGRRCSRRHSRVCKEALLPASNVQHTLKHRAPATGSVSCVAHCENLTALPRLDANATRSHRFPVEARSYAAVRARCIATLLTVCSADPDDDWWCAHGCCQYRALTSSRTMPSWLACDGLQRACHPLQRFLPMS